MRTLAALQDPEERNRFLHLLAAIEALRNQVWRKQVTKAALAEYETSHTVLSSRLVAGNPVIHVFANARPEEGFEQVSPDMEDVCFQRLRQQARQSAEHAPSLAAARAETSADF